ncbi:MAG: type II toxin-antitoxin system VapC family toxin [Gemmatimonadetes bacterium]|nr:type II toxin-antitoxin system VapC family toxin [Gemmatimonadota bacterium]
MVVDTSAVIAILFAEPMADRLEDAILGSPRPALSAASLAEASIVALVRRDEPAERELDLLLARHRLQIVPVTEHHAGIAREAYRQFGKGRHPAGLNFGDCFSYALARTLGEPLLFTGEDFSRTDVEVAPY